MVTKEQKEKYTALHDKLCRVYLKKEKHREDTVAFYQEITATFKQMREDWEKVAEQDIENKIDQILFENRREQSSKAIDAFSDLMKRFQDHSAENLKVYDRLENAMREMLAEHKRLGTPQLSYKESGKILSALERKIEGISNKIDEAERSLIAYKDELVKVELSNAAIKQLDEFENIASDISMGIASPEIADALKNSMEKNTDNLYFLLKIYKPWHKEAIEALLNVMHQQLPEIKPNSNKDLNRYIKDVNINIAHELIFQLHALIKSQHEGMIPSEKYPKLDSWREFYCKPETPHYVTDEDKRIEKMTEQEWEVYKQFENEKIDIFHRWKEERKQQWYDAMQPLNFKYLPALNELNGDYWILYAVTMRDNYESWKTGLENIESVLDYGMNPAILLQPFDDLVKAIGEIDWKTRNRLEEKRDQRIYGKEYEKYKRKHRHPPLV